MIRKRKKKGKKLLNKHEEKCKNCSSKAIDKRNSATVENVNFNNRKFSVQK